MVIDTGLKVLAATSALMGSRSQTDLFSCLGVKVTDLELLLVFALKILDNYLVAFR